MSTCSATPTPPAAASITRRCRERRAAIGRRLSRAHAAWSRSDGDARLSARLRRSTIPDDDRRADGPPTAGSKSRWCRSAASLVAPGGEEGAEQLRGFGLADPAEHVRAGGGRSAGRRSERRGPRRRPWDLRRRNAARRSGRARSPRRTSRTARASPTKCSRRAAGCRAASPPARMATISAWAVGSTWPRIALRASAT